MSDSVNIRREWAMPSRHTFTIKPIAALLSQHPIDEEWVDPFAGFNSPAGITNDLNPDVPSLHHLPALDFLRGLEDRTAPGVLFDPPYSSRQVAECYRSIGREVTAEDTRATFWSHCKDEIARVIRPGGTVISFGWSSQGMGKTRGFEMTEILLVPHGGPHYDTIVTVEVKK